MKTKTNKQTKNDNKYGEKERNNQTETFKKGTKEQRKIEEREEGRKKKKTPKGCRSRKWVPCK